MASSSSTAAPTAPELPPDYAVQRGKIPAWRAKDVAYSAHHPVVRQHTHQQAQLAFTSANSDWLGPIAEGNSGLRVRFDHERLKERGKGVRGPQRQELQLGTPRHARRRRAKEREDAEERLIPIRLEIEHEPWKLRDTFTWNLLPATSAQQQQEAELFAAHLCEDLRLPAQHFYRPVVEAIKKQIEEARVSEGYEGAYATAGMLLDEDEDDEKPKGLRDWEMPSHKAMRERNEELRILIKLDITISSIQLVDQFEWDLSLPLSFNSPEVFARTFCADLGLTGDFETAVAHAIREQVDAHTRSLCLLGYQAGGAVGDEDLRQAFLPPLLVPFRVGVDEAGGGYTPTLSLLSPDELDRNDKEREREARRKRRQTKGRGMNLPDREPVKTHRTLVPAKTQGGRLEPVMDANENLVWPEIEVMQAPPVRGYRPVEEDAMDTDVEDSDSEEDVVGPGAAKRKAKGRKSKGALKRWRALHPEGVEVPPEELFEEPRLTRRKLAGYLQPFSLAALNPASGVGVGGVPLVGGGVGGGDGGGEEVGGYATSMGGMRRQEMMRDMGLHECVIDGVWHCGNCGAPDGIAIGRRKGPMGKKTLCGQCGVYWLRFKRQRPCEYTTDTEIHSKYRDAAVAAQEAEKKAKKDSKNASKLKKRGAAREAREAAAAGQGAGTPMSVDNDKSSDSDSEGSQLSDPPTINGGSDDEPDLPLASTSSKKAPASGASNNKGKATVKLTRGGGGRATASPAPSVPAKGAGKGNVTLKTAPSAAAPPPPPPVAAPVAAPAPPKQFPAEWMQRALNDLRKVKPDDKFDIVLRPRATDPTITEWRVKCLDCPGKLYNLGPGESLDNFAVHLKNKAHLERSQARMAADAGL